MASIKHMTIYYSLIVFSALLMLAGVGVSVASMLYSKINLSPTSSYIEDSHKYQVVDIDFRCFCNYDKLVVYCLKPPIEIDAVSFNVFNSTKAVMEIKPLCTKVLKQQQKINEKKEPLRLANVQVMCRSGFKSAMLEKNISEEIFIGNILFIVGLIGLSLSLWYAKKKGI